MIVKNSSMILAGIFFCAMCGCAPLGERLISGAPGDRAAIVKKINKGGREEQEKAVSRSLSALGSADLKRRKDAAAALAAIGSPAVPAIVEILKGTDTASVKTGITILGDMREEGAAAVPELILMMNGRDIFSAGLAKEALVKIGAPAVPGLIALLSDQDSIKNSDSIGILRRIGASAVKAVGEAALTADTNLRQKLYLFLFSLGNEVKIEDAISSVLASFSDPAQSRGICMSLLMRIGPPAIPGLIAALGHEDAGVRRDTSMVLTHICYKNNCGLERFLPELRPVLNDPDDTVRKNMEGLLSLNRTLGENYWEIIRREQNPPKKIPCRPDASDRERRDIPSRPEYFGAEEYLNLLDQGMLIKGATPGSISFTIPQCGLSAAELGEIVISRIFDDHKTEVFHVTVKNGEATAEINAEGKYFLQIPFRILDTSGPVLELKYDAREVPGSVPHLKSSQLVEVKAVDRSSHSFAVSGIGGVYVLFNKKPSPACSNSTQSPKAPFGSNRNCVYKGPFLVPEGIQRLEVFSFDKLGNIGEPVALTIFSDASPAVDVLKRNGRKLSPGSTVYAEPTDTFTIVSTDSLPKSVASGEIKTFMLVDIPKDECSYWSSGGVDGKWSCEDPLYRGAFSLPSGEHIIYFSSEDAVGNRSAEKQVKVIVRARG